MFLNLYLWLLALIFTGPGPAGDSFLIEGEWGVPKGFLVTKVEFFIFGPRNAANNRYNQEVWFLFLLGKMNNTFGNIHGDFGYPFIENPTQGCIE